MDMNKHLNQRITAHMKRATELWEAGDVEGSLREAAASMNVRWAQEDADKQPLNLCLKHAQEPNHSHYDPTNCDYCKLVEQRDELLEALEAAKSMLETASRYFPKSIRNGDRYSLCNVLANAVDPAIAKAKGGAGHD